MRRNIKIVGIGNRVAGVSKAGKDYDFVPISFSFWDENMKGVHAETCNIPYEVFSEAALEIDGNYDAVMHYYNYKVVIDAIL